MKDNSKFGSSDSLIAAVRSIMEKQHTVPKGDKEKKLAALAHPKDKITHKDVLVGRGVLKKENSGERMGVIVGTRKEKVELEPKLKESNDHEKVKSSIARIHADLIKHVPVGHHYWMDAHHSEGPLSDSDHENHKQTARSDEVRIKVSQHRDEEGYHHVVIHSPHKEDVKAAADHLYDDKSVMKKGKDDDAHYAKGIKEQANDSDHNAKVKHSIARIHADLIKHVPVGHHYWMDAHHSEGPLSDSDHENHKQTARSDEVSIKVSQHRDAEGNHHVVIHSPRKEDVKAAADHLYDDKSVMKKGKHDDAHYAKGIKEGIETSRKVAKMVGNAPRPHGEPTKLSTILKNRRPTPAKPFDASEFKKKNEEVESVDERKLTGAETGKKEKYVMSLKKKMGGFKKRYGERAKEVMYATATKMAKEETVPVQEISTGLASRYLKKTDPETSSPKEVEKRKTGRALALTKKWGGRVSGTSAPKVPTKD